MLFNSHNSDNIEIRPRFKLFSDFGSEEILEKINKALPEQSDVVGIVKGTHAFLRIQESKEHYWSPVMEVVVEKDEDDIKKTSIRCLLGPKPSIWMMLMFIYVGVGVFSVFGGMYGLAKWNLGKESIFIWAFPVGLFIFGIIYFTSKYGQRKGRDQMLHLVSFLYHAIDDGNLVRL